jgi:hypothetical protein
MILISHSEAGRKAKAQACAIQSAIYLILNSLSNHNQWSPVIVIAIQSQ